MFDFVRRVWTYFGTAKQEGPLPFEEAVAILEKKEEVEPSAEGTATPEISEDACFQRSGQITFIDEHYGIIDGNLYFDNLDSYNYNVNDTVTYLAYTIKNETKISKIIGKVDGEWDLPKSERHSVLERKILGKVYARIGRVVKVNPNEISCNLNYVESEFIPIIGDWVELVSVVQVIDASSISDLMETVLEVKKISPVRPKTVNGVIKVYNQETGVGLINNEIKFWQDACVPGYVPIVRDKVIAEVIESEQGVFNWRAVKIVPCDESTNKCYSISDNPARNRPFENKCGIVISNNTSIILSGIGENTTFVVQILNSSDVCQTITDISINVLESQITLLSPSLKNNVIIQPKDTQIIKFMVVAQFMGMTKELLTFTFEGFFIVRWIKLNVSPKIDHKNLIKNYYQRNEKNLTKSARESFLSTNKDIVIGERPVKPPSFISNKLPMYDVPERIMDLLFTQMEACQYVGHIPIEKFSPSLKADLNIQNYEDRFHNLLYLEELALTVNMRRYDLERACFIKDKEFLMLEVQDLSERRPSIIVGDRVYASNPNVLNSPKCEGFVHKTGARHLYLKFNQRFHNTYTGEDYSIEFHSSRTNFRRYHQAVDLAAKTLGKAFLFPSSVPKKQPQVLFTIEDDDDHASQASSSNSEFSSGYISDLIPASNKIEELTPEKDEQAKPKVIKSKYVEMARKIHLNPRRSTSPNQPDDSPKAEPKPLPEQDESPKLDLEKDSDPNNKLLTKKNCSKLSVKKYNALSKKNGFCEKEPTPQKLEWYDKNLNQFQKAAVLNIIRGEARPLPYFIFGPPGTGKTVTLIETILQLVKLIPYSRLLVVTPSNSAADLIALRLLDAGTLIPGDMVRMVAFRVVAEGTVPERLLPYCSTGDLAREGSREAKYHSQNGIKMGVQQSVLGRHRITIGTCMVVGVLYTMGFPRGHFSHIIIDEAGQATEPEMMIPLSLLDTSSAQTVLAGDPLQLGPCVFSLLSKEHGLGESFFERIITRFPYVRDPIGFPETNGFDPRLVTRLIYNYRSIPEILKLPNTLFYNSELIPVISGKEGKEVDLLRSISEMLPESRNEFDLPPSVMFHGVRGENYQTMDCPSWFNPVEAGQVFYYVNDLYRLGLTAKDIGIITPYIKQGQQVRKLLIQSEMELPKIGSVEEFQGQEFRVVILSTVRSNETGAKNDARYGLGFIASPRRLNVAITRAKSLLIIIGNPHLLYTDNYWRSVLIYAVKIGGYRGCDLPDMYGE